MVVDCTVTSCKELRFLREIQRCGTELFLTGTASYISLHPWARCDILTASKSCQLKGGAELRQRVIWSRIADRPGRSSGVSCPKTKAPVQCVVRKLVSSCSIGTPTSVTLEPSLKCRTEL